MALFWRIWTAVVLVNLVVLTLFVGLAALQFDSINATLIGERLNVLAGRTAAPFRAAARIGLPLSTVRNAEALLERARQTDDAIAAIHVFDPEGRIVHSTAQPRPGAIPADAIAARAAAAGAPWHRETGSGFLSSIDIPASDGRSAGGILIVYPGEGSVTRVRAMTAELAMAAIAVQIVAAAVGIALLRFGLRRPLATFDAIETAIVDFERRSWRSAAAARAAPEPPSGDGTDDLGRLLDEAEARYRATGAELEVRP